MPDESSTVPAQSEDGSDGLEQQKHVSTGSDDGEIPLLQLIEKVAERSQSLSELIQDISESYLETQATKARIRLGMATLAVTFVALVVFGMGYLTYVGRIPGSTFTFMMGLIVGYMLNFLQGVSGLTSPRD